jgi:hypothetical protein
VTLGSCALSRSIRAALPLLAHRALYAAAIRLRAAGDMVRPVRQGLEPLSHDCNAVASDGDFLRRVETGVVATVSASPVCRFLTVIVAPGMTAPLGSVTTPLNWPFWICARLEKMRTRATLKTWLSRMVVLPKLLAQ